MEKPIFLATILTILALGIISPVRAQEVQDSTTYMIETIDGNEFTGYILSRDSVNITFFTEKFGTVNIPISLLKKIEEIDPAKMTDKGYLFENPQATRYFFAPNGYGLRKGEAYYQNLWILYNQVSFGITNNISCGIGTVPIFLFGAKAMPLWITPKVSIPVVENKFNLGLGVFAGTVLSAEEAANPAGIFYGTATFGNRDKNLSIGLGYGFAGSNTSNTPIINISGMVRISARTYFLTENYIIGGSDAFGLISMGGRSIMKKISLDYGGFIPIAEGMNSPIIIPWLGINVSIGKKNVEEPKQ